MLLLLRLWLFRHSAFGRKLPRDRWCQAVHARLAGYALCARRHCLAELLAKFRRDVGRRRMLAQLQCADVSDDLPTIINRNLLRVIGHPADTVGYDVEEMPYRRITQ